MTVPIVEEALGEEFDSLGAHSIEAPSVSKKKWLVGLGIRIK